MNSELTKPKVANHVILSTLHPGAKSLTGKKWQGRAH